MAEIKFEKYRRECGHNTEEAKKLSNPRFINDFRVLIDGELRALLKRDMHGQGYYLTDPDHVGIADKSDWRSVIEIKSQANFKSEIEVLLAKGMIPTLAQIAEARTRRELEKAERKAAEIEEQRIQKIQMAAMPMYDALKEVLLYLDAPPDSPRHWPVSRAAMYGKVKRALIEADTGQPATLEFES